MQKSQEILHRYAAIDKTQVLRAGEIAHSPALLSARDAVHIAAMGSRGIRSILSLAVCPLSGIPGRVRAPVN
jgi:predicted nucleic acid-binding protein